MQLQPHDLHICPYSHGTSCVFQPNADQMLDRFVDNIRHCGDKPNQTAGQQLQSCGREMHTSGSQHRSTIFKIAVTLYINTHFEQFAACSHAGHSPFLASWIPSRSQAFQKMPTFLFALCNSSCILTFALTESCPSGRRSTIGNRVGVKSVSRVQIPDSPPVNSKAGLRACFVFTPRGGVAEWLNAAVSKTVWPV